MRRRFRLEELERRILLAAVTGVSPLPHSNSAAVTDPIAATYDQSINPSSVTLQSVAVHASQSGRLLSAAAIEANEATLVIESDGTFFPGEVVQVSATGQIQTAELDLADPYVWQFRAATAPSFGAFRDSLQALGPHSSNHAALGDLDGDGDLDAFVANGFGNQANRVWINDAGVFTDSGQELGNTESYGVSLGDLDGDGDLDAFVTNGGVSGEPNRVWLNEGGVFTDSGQRLGDHASFGSALGDFDGDGDLDAFVANGTSQANRVWLNDDGVFTDTGQRLGADVSSAVDLGDFDGDGDLDAVTANLGANRIYVNDAGTFTDSGQLLGDAGTAQIAVGDLDSDGDVDFFSANYFSFQPDRIWFNEGGVFTVSEQEITGHDTTGVTLGDLDGDGDLDAFLSTLGFPGEPAAVWFNNGSGHFINSGQAVGRSPSVGAALGDLDLDGDLDAFVINLNQNTVFLNDAPAVFHVTDLALAESGLTVRFNRELDVSELNLFDTEIAALGDPDVVLEGQDEGSIRGSLTVAADLKGITFTNTGEPLAHDIYTLTLRGGAGGLRDQDGNWLNASATNPSGHDHVERFPVTETSDLDRRVWIPDLARGPGQEVNLLGEPATGLPLMISQGESVRTIRLQIRYDPALLDITAATVAPGMPEGSVVGLTHSEPGNAVVEFRTTFGLPAGEHAFAYLRAVVPIVDAGQIYGRHHVLDIHSGQIENFGIRRFEMLEDDAVHVATFFGDVSANGRINAGDASALARVASRLDSGFGESLLVDPLIVADISGNGRLNASDASLVARHVALQDIPYIPPLPTAVSSQPGAAFATRSVTPQHGLAASLPLAGREFSAVPANAFGELRAAESPPPVRSRTLGIASETERVSPLQDAVDALLALEVELEALRSGLR